MCTAKHVLVKKKKSSLQMGLSLWGWMENIVHGVEIFWHSNEEKVSGK